MGLIVRFEKITFAIALNKNKFFQDSFEESSNTSVIYVQRELIGINTSLIIYLLALASYMIAFLNI